MNLVTRLAWLGHVPILEPTPVVKGLQGKRVVAGITGPNPSSASRLLLCHQLVMPRIPLTSSLAWHWFWLTPRERTPCRPRLSGSAKSFHPTGLCLLSSSFPSASGRGCQKQRLDLKIKKNTKQK